MIAPNSPTAAATASPLRVLMTTDTVGGVWTYTTQLAAALKPLGIEVVLATEGPRMSETQRRKVEVMGLEVHESEYRLEWMPGAWEDVEAAGVWLEQLAGEVRADVVHFNSYSHGSRQVGVPKVVVGHSCVLSWFDAVKGTAAPLEWRRYQDNVTRGLSGADAVIAPSRTMMGYIEKFYGKQPHERVIYNGRDPQMFKPGVKEPMVFSAGRFWDEAKNIRLLESAADELRWPVFVAGQGNRDWHRVQSLGQLEEKEIARWLGSAAIYALPARYEPFGLSVLEAALAGCALVLGDISSLREIWGDAAEYIDPDDASGLAQVIERLIRDDRRRHKLAERARQRATQYTHTRMAEQYAEVYRSLLSGSALGAEREKAVSAAATARSGG